MLSDVINKNSIAYKRYQPLKNFLLERTNRTIFIDLETDTREGVLLSNERILAIGLLEYSSSDCRSLVLAKNNNESEKRLLSSFDEYLDNIEPDVVVGYGIRYYDIPLLSQKYTLYRKGLKLYGLSDMIDTSLIVDLAPFYGYRKLSNIILNLDGFDAHCKRLERESESSQKARWVYDKWRKSRRGFKKYLECDLKACRELYEQLLGEL
ncbi:MAG: 3'-5' exonuclease [Candidatus Caldarchaeum sp.]